MTYDQIRSKIYLRTKTNVTSLPNANLNLYTQPAEDRITSLIIQADGRWQYDDRNYTDLAIATTSIVSGQQDYSLPVNYLRIDRVEVKDSDGNWTKLEKYDQKDEPNTALSDLAANESGIPDRYDIMGNSIFLSAVPDYSQAASIKVYFQRGPLKYDYTANTNAGQFTDGSGSGATTDTPGFNSMYHDLIVDWASYNYGVDNNLNNANQIFVEIQRKEQALQDDYLHRFEEERPTLSPYEPSFE